MSSQIVPATAARKSLATMLQSPDVQRQFAAALPRVGITPERMTRFALTALNRSPALLKTNPQTFLGCIVQSAQLGLDPSGITGEAYLVPYKDVCTFIIGYRGLLKLARRSGKINEAAAHVVHEKDVFEYQYGLDSKLVHKPSTDADPGRITFAYAYAKFTDGGRAFEVMTREQIEGVKAQSKASNNGPWVTHFDEMARKTAFRRLAKWLPLEPEDYRAVELAAQEEQGIPQDLRDVMATQPETVPADATVRDSAPSGDLTDEEKRQIEEEERAAARAASEAVSK